MKINNMEDLEYVPYTVEYETRWKVTDKNGNIVDDAQGYGYKTKQKAIKAMWYRQNKNSFPQRQKNARQIIEKNKELFKKNYWILEDYDIIVDGGNTSTEFWKKIDEENHKLFNNLTKKEKNDIEKLLIGKWNF